jgi:hypothetical protein
MKITYNCESLDRHGITEQEADEVYATGKDYDMEPSNSGNDRIMLVGWTSGVRLLEIGVEYMPHGHDHIFHTSDATKFYRELFEREK